MRGRRAEETGQDGAEHSTYTCAQYVSTGTERGIKVKQSWMNKTEKPGHAPGLGLNPQISLKYGGKGRILIVTIHSPWAEL